MKKEKALKYLEKMEERLESIRERVATTKKYINCDQSKEAGWHAASIQRSLNFTSDDVVSCIQALCD